MTSPDVPLENLSISPDAAASVPPAPADCPLVIATVLGEFRVPFPLDLDRMCDDYKTYGARFNKFSFPIVAFELCGCKIEVSKKGRCLIQSSTMTDLQRAHEWLVNEMPKYKSGDQETQDTVASVTDGSLRIANIVARCQFPFHLDLDRMRVDYNAHRSKLAKPSIRFQLHGGNVWVFESGKCVLSNATMANMQSAHASLIEDAHKYKLEDQGTVS